MVHNWDECYSTFILLHPLNYSKICIPSSSVSKMLKNYLWKIDLILMHMWKITTLSIHIIFITYNFMCFDKKQSSWKPCMFCFCEMLCAYIYIVIDFASSPFWKAKNQPKKLFPKNQEKGLSETKIYRQSSH